jgi:hypothetical protein
MWWVVSFKLQLLHYSVTWVEGLVGYNTSMDMVVKFLPIWGTEAWSLDSSLSLQSLNCSAMYLLGDAYFDTVADHIYSMQILNLLWGNKSMSYSQESLMCSSSLKCWYQPNLVLVFSVAKNISHPQLVLSARRFLIVRTLFLQTEMLRELCDIVLPGRAFEALAIQWAQLWPCVPWLCTYNWSRIEDVEISPWQDLSPATCLHNYTGGKLMYA